MYSTKTNTSCGCQAHYRKQTVAMFNLTALKLISHVKFMLTDVMLILLETGFAWLNT